MLGQIGHEDREAPNGAAAQPALDGRAKVQRDLAIHFVGRARGDRQQPARGQLARGGDDRRPALAGQLAERGQVAQLAARSSIELAHSVREGFRLADDRDGENVGRDVPRLIGDDAQLHESGLLLGYPGICACGVG